MRTTTPSYRIRQHYASWRDGVSGGSVSQSPSRKQFGKHDDSRDTVCQPRNRPGTPHKSIGLAAGATHMVVRNARAPYRSTVFRLGHFGSSEPLPASRTPDHASSVTAVETVSDTPGRYKDLNKLTSMKCSWIIFPRQYTSIL